MNKIIIYGIGTLGKLVVRKLLDNPKYEIVALADKNLGEYEGFNIIQPMDILSERYDEILIAVYEYDMAQEIYSELRELGINFASIKVLYYDPDFIEFFSDQRSEFIRGCAEYIIASGIPGCVAECGVYRGDSAEYINKYFTNRKLYLFDTSESFDAGDYEAELARNGDAFNSKSFSQGVFSNTSIEIVLSKMSYRENIVFKVGRFPETAFDIDEKFCFVNLDMDLYKPMFDGLEFFCSKMSDGGVILLHDYFSNGLVGVKEAVNDFESATGERLRKMPIGDGSSLAIVF